MSTRPVSVCLWAFFLNSLREVWYLAQDKRDGRMKADAPHRGNSITMRYLDHSRDLLGCDSLVHNRSESLKDSWLGVKGTRFSMRWQGFSCQPAGGCHFLTVLGAAQVYLSTCLEVTCHIRAERRGTARTWSKLHYFLIYNHWDALSEGCGGKVAGEHVPCYISISENEGCGAEGS